MYQRKVSDTNLGRNTLFIVYIDIYISVCICAMEIDEYDD
jgi:hypothetical protein